MATYIQGQQDYITQVQPTAPNLQFDAQILGLKQSKYDANHKKVSDLYGSLLNSDMTRTENNLARNEFFKIINSDIKKMGSFDFSLDANVTAAASIFESIYTNQNIVKDMVWTKNYNNEITRMNGFKNCIKEEDCGGTYWETGARYMQYKKEEFENASTGEALSTQNVEFIPDKNVMKEAIKLAKAADLNVTMDKLNGNYIVRTKNGDLLKDPLTILFAETIGKDPKFAAKFLAESYVERNNWVANKVNLGEFSTKEEAELGYLKNIDATNDKTLKSQASSLSIDLYTLDTKIKYYEEQYKKGELQEGTTAFQNYESLLRLQQNAQAASEYTQSLRQALAQQNPNTALGALLESSDQRNAYIKFNASIKDAVSSLAYKNYEVTYTPDKFAEMKTKFGFDTLLEDQKHKHDLYRDKKNNESREKIATAKLAAGKKAATGSNFAAQNASNQAESAVEAYQANRQTSVWGDYETDFGVASATDRQNAKNAYENGRTGTPEYEMYKKYLDLDAGYDAKLAKLKTDANKKKYAAGNKPKYFTTFSKGELQTLSQETDDALRYDEMDALMDMTHRVLGKNSNGIQIAPTQEQAKKIEDMYNALPPEEQIYPKIKEILQ
jgi:hypothetical protein